MGLWHQLLGCLIRVARGTDLYLLCSLQALTLEKPDSQGIFCMALSVNGIRKRRIGSPR